MGQKKGQTGNPNGRPKGTPNKTTGELKEWIKLLINNNRTQFEADLKEVEPEKRLIIIEKLIQYVVPKQQSISVEDQIQIEYMELGELLENAPDEVVERIVQRIEQLKLIQDNEQKR